MEIAEEKTPEKQGSYLNMNQQKSMIWKQPRFLLFIVAIIIITLGYRVTNTIVNVLNQQWQQYHSPYDIKKEFLLNTLLRAHRTNISTITFGLMDDWVAEMHQHIAQDVKSKVGIEDVVWIEFWYDSEAHFWFKGDVKNVEAHLAEAQEKIDLLISKTSQVKKFDAAIRYRVWADLLKYIINAPQTTLSYEERHKYLLKLSGQSILMINKMDMGYLIRDKHLQITPFIALDALQDVYSELIYLEQTKGLLDCQSQQVENFKYLISKIIELETQYKHLVLQPYISHRIDAVSRKAKQEQSYISKYCN